MSVSTKLDGDLSRACCLLCKSFNTRLCWQFIPGSAFR